MWRKVLVFLVCATLTPLIPPATAAASRCDYLSAPTTLEQLTDTGDFAAWSPDGRHVAFIDDGEPGQVYELALATRERRCLTCHLDTRGFLSVYYDRHANLILTGAPEGQTQASVDRFLRAEIFWLEHAPGTVPAGPAQALGQPIWEHVAVSRDSDMIAWSITWQNDPLRLGPQPTRPDDEWFRSEIYTGRIEVVNGLATLVDREIVVDDVGVYEPQDFRRNDAELLWTSYQDPDRREFWEPDGGRSAFPIDADGEAFGVNLETGALTNYTNNPAFDEAEGMFPGGAFDVIESDRDTGEGAFGRIDIYVLKLDGSGRKVRRLTYQAEEANRKAHQPVVSPDGRSILFTRGVTSDFGPAPDPRHFTGASEGLHLLRFEC